MILNMSATCCFFGHRDVHEPIRSKLKAEISKLLESNPETEFLVGHQGQFDALVLSVLEELRRERGTLNYSVVLAYLPEDKSKLPTSPEHTLYPEGIEASPKRFAISWRNRWLVNQADVVICYIRHSTGGAAKYVELAQKRGKRIINIGK